MDSSLQIWSAHEPEIHFAILQTARQILGLTSSNFDIEKKSNSIFSRLHIVAAYKKICATANTLALYLYLDIHICRGLEIIGFEILKLNDCLILEYHDYILYA